MRIFGLMKNNKRLGFTLAETLITLSIIGTLALIVVPGLIKDTMNRTMISAVKSTATDLNDAINTELVNKRAVSIKDTDIYKDPVNFLKTYLSPIKTAEDNSLFAPKYKTINGISGNTQVMNASATLKNGVSVGIKTISGGAMFFMFIDVNGLKEPNVFGVDYFPILLQTENSPATGVHAGDLGCSAATHTSIASCKSGGSFYCYCALERSGFDHKYLEYSYMY